jgi:hypothetical protein
LKPNQELPVWQNNAFGFFRALGLTTTTSKCHSHPEMDPKTWMFHKNLKVGAKQF